MKRIFLSKELAQGKNSTRVHRLLGALLSPEMTRQEEKDIIEIERGIEKGCREDIMHMLMNNKTPEQIAEFCGYDLEYVKAIQEEMLQSV